MNNNNIIGSTLRIECCCCCCCQERRRSYSKNRLQHLCRKRQQIFLGLFGVIVFGLCFYNIVGSFKYGYLSDDTKLLLMTTTLSSQQHHDIPTIRSLKKSSNNRNNNNNNTYKKLLQSKNHHSLHPRQQQHKQQHPQEQTLISINNTNTTVVVVGERNETVIKSSSNLSSSWKQSPPPPTTRNTTDTTTKDAAVTTTTTTTIIRTKQQQNKTIIRRQPLITPDGKVFEHYFSHIPKSGGSYAFKVLQQLFMVSPQRRKLKKKDKYRPCNMGTVPISKFATDYHLHWQGTKCTMWQSEYPYTNLASHVYTIVRDPKQIIISMYFHCKESKHHIKKAHLMPNTLDEWLNEWVDAINNETKIKQNNDKFQCYNPIDFQSKFTAFKYNINGINTNTSTSNYLEDAIDDIKTKFDVIGDTAQMTKSVCAIYIRYTGWIPRDCDCTPKGSKNNNKLRQQQQQQQQQPKQNQNQNQNRRRLLQQELPQPKQQQQRPQIIYYERLSGYNMSQHSHGVSNHGATFNTTSKQDDAISKLTTKDQILYYEVVKNVFEQQIIEIETEYHIKVCNEFKYK